LGIGDWGIGDWGLGIGPNPQSPIPNPQSPIPNPQLIINLNNLFPHRSPFFIFKIFLYFKNNYLRLFYFDKKI
jgi:hypothetical protein